MRAAIVDKRQNRPVIEQHAPVSGATGPAAGIARKLYHDGVVSRIGASGMDTQGGMMGKFRRDSPPVGSPGR